MRLKTNCVTAVGLAILLAMSTSCQEYDLDKLNGEVTVGGDSLAFPLGSTDSIKLTTFIESEDLEMLKTDENGNYYLTFSQDFNQVIDMTDYTDDVLLDGVEVDLQKTMVIPEFEDIDGTARSTAKVDMDFDEEFSVEYSFEAARESGLVDIYRVLFEDVALSVGATMTTNGRLPDGMEVQIAVEFPENYVFEASPMVDGNNVLFSGEVYSDGHVEFDPLGLEEITFDLPESSPFVFTDTFHISTLTLIVDSEEIEGLTGYDLDVDIHVLVGGSGTGHEMVPSGFYGKLDMTLDPIERTVALEGVPDFMKEDGVVLDFYRPYVELDLGTNIGIPIVVDGSIDAIGGTDAHLSFSLPVPYSYDSEVMEYAYYYMSDEPGDFGDGREWVEADINSLLTSVPDEVGLSVVPHTDLSIDAEHYVDYNAEYAVEGVFNMTVPFAFGDELNMTVEQVIDGLDPRIGTLLEMTSINIGGQLTSTFPVKVLVTAEFLDPDGNPLDVEVSVQEINSCGSDGNPVVTPLNLTVYKTGRSEEVEAVALKFTLLPGNEPGVSFTNKAFIQADIEISAQGGLTLEV